MTDLRNSLGIARGHFEGSATDFVPRSAEGLGENAGEDARHWEDTELRQEEGGKVGKGNWTSGQPGPKQRVRRRILRIFFNCSSITRYS